MLGLFGLCNTNPAQFQITLKHWLLSHEIDIIPYKPTLLGFEEWPTEIKGLVFVPTVSLLLSRLTQLYESNVIVFVFDTAVLLDYLKPIQILDLGERRQSFVYTYQSINLHALMQDIEQMRRYKEHVEIEQTAIDVIPNLLGNTKGSVLSPLLTYLYTIKDTERRFVTQALLYNHIAYGTDHNLPDTKAAAKLMAALETEIATNTIKAMREWAKSRAAGKSVNMEKLAIKHDVAVFDLKYLQFQLSKLKEVPTDIA